MNDPGLDRPISDAGNEVDGLTGDGTYDQEEEEEKTYLDPRSVLQATRCVRFRY